MSRRILLAALALVPVARRASASAGVSGAQVLAIEQGARGLGMGGAYSAVVDDADGLWWNPAGIARSEFSEATLSHTAYLDSVATEHLGFVRPYAPARGTLGASFTYLNVPGIDQTDASGNVAGTLKANGYVGALSYGAAVSPELTVGATAKLVSQTLGSTSGSGFAADVGAQYWGGDYGAAVVVQNLGPSFKIGSESDPLPRDLRAGAFYKPRSQFLLSFEEEKPYGDTARAHIGGEWLVSQAIRLRAGFQQVPNVAGAGVTVGFGLAGAYGGGRSGGEHSSDASVAKPFWESMASGQDFKAAVKNGAYIIGVDYAFVSYGSTLTDVHRITLTARF